MYVCIYACIYVCTFVCMYALYVRFTPVLKTLYIIIKIFDI